MRYQRSQATKRRKIGAEAHSCCRADEEDSESDIGNGACDCSIMKDMSSEDILKLQDELQVLRSKNCRLTNSECLTEATFQENDAKVEFCTFSSA